MIKLGVVGCGYLGAVHAAAMASLGHDVVGYDVDADKVEALSHAKAPFFEPELDELLTSTLASGRLSFVHDMSRLADRDVVFVCVGTPQRRGELAADTRHVEAAFTKLAAVVPTRCLLVGKSTVPVGTARAMAERVREITPGLEVAWNPEFLREGKAIEDTLRPDRLVFGVESARAERKLRKVYADALSRQTPLVVTDFETAELVKVSANAFLATKISFINAMAEVCEVAGADVVQLAEAIGHDDRIGRKFLGPGLGFGGGCLPKDIRAFMARAGELGADQALSFLKEVDAINMRRRSRMVELTLQECGGTVIGKRIAVLGAAFKPGSDDIRDSPALNVAAQLRLLGADVVVTDPQALDNAKRLWPDLHYVGTPEEACEGAHCILLLTEWERYRNLDPQSIGETVAAKSVLDGRNALDAKRWTEAGFTYRALGRRRIA